MKEPEGKLFSLPQPEEYFDGETELRLNVLALAVEATTSGEHGGGDVIEMAEAMLEFVAPKRIVDPHNDLHRKLKQASTKDEYDAIVKEHQRVAGTPLASSTEDDQ